MTKELVSDKSDKPVLDEQTFARLLEAAYVLQQHHHREPTLNLAFQLRAPEAAPSPSEPSHPGTAAPDANDDYSPTLAQIVETQRLIQMGHLDLENAMGLVAKRVAQITKSSGAAIGIVEGKMVRYRTVAGPSSPPRGTEVAMGKALCFSCLRTGQPFRCPDVNAELLLDAEAWRGRGIQSLIAVPVYHGSGISGALELYFAEANAFGEPDVHTCQLMAGLVTEALTRVSPGAPNESQDERASMLEAFEKLKPNLGARLEASTAKDTPARSVNPSAVTAAQPFLCRMCGHELVGEEQFCGKCGAPRIADSGPPSLQSKLASLQRMREAKQQTVRLPANGAGHQSLASKLALQHDPEEARSENDAFRPGAPAPPAKETTEDLPSRPEAGLSIGQQVLEIHATKTDSRKTDGADTWRSAAKAREFLEELSVSEKRSALRRIWNTRRGDIYLAVAVILMAGVIRWGMWSNHSVSATARTGASGESHRRQAPYADLSLFDRLLISVGLAEAPEAPEYKGNPETQVWVDLHTAQYYCPGADLYGKTTKGKFTTQRDAQLDQFEPAYRKACD